MDTKGLTGHKGGISVIDDPLGTTDVVDDILTKPAPKKKTPMDAARALMAQLLDELETAKGEEHKTLVRKIRRLKRIMLNPPTRILCQGKGKLRCFESTTTANKTARDAMRVKAKAEGSKGLKGSRKACKKILKKEQ